VAASSPRLIAIVGPTASGKSALALAIAAEVPAEIVSCDSLQVYRGLDIGSSKPTVAERAAVPHHLLDVVDPRQDFSAADYARLAGEAVRDVAVRGRLPLVVGGAGLYFRALFRGLFEGPRRDEAFRRRVEQMADRFGDARLHRLLARVDPEAAARIRVRDRIRIVRALEVFRATGRPISDMQRATSPGLQGFRTLFLGLAPERAALKEAVERRARAMFDAGLVDEVRRLLAAGLDPQARPLQSIGYRQALAVVQEGMAPAWALDETVRETLRYAKRQRTWFRRETGIAWHPDRAAALAAVREWLASRSPSL
jgi:tRNA dimethylallyltransferase